MFERLQLDNFTSFAHAEFDFVKGINVYAGANGSGKTHILKILYSLQKNQVLGRDPSSREALDVTLMSVFKPDALGRLVRRQRGRNACDILATWNRKPVSIHFSTKDKQVHCDQAWKLKHAPILIPAKDILGHSVNFIEAYDTLNSDGERWLDFDVTYRDLLTHANPNVQKGPIPPEQDALLESLRKQMTGTVIRSKSGRFYLKDSAGKIEFPLVAEGWRKLGLLWILIRNGSLTTGSVLYWDEPEANLNPEMLPMLAEILSKLAETGTQIHVATHSYAFLRELEHVTKASQRGYRIFALDRTKDGVKVNPCERFVDIKPNPILVEHERIFRLSVKEALKRE